MKPQITGAGHKLPSDRNGVGLLFDLKFLANICDSCEYMPIVTPIAIVGNDALIPEGGILPVCHGSSNLEPVDQY